MPCSFILATCAGLSRKARMPPWIFGCRVFTRPSIISGKPVSSETSFTAILLSRKSAAVPPVETSSIPNSRERAGKFDDAFLFRNADEGPFDPAHCWYSS